MTGDDAKGLSPADAAKLARLVAKYGPRAVISAVGRVRYPKRAGRPRTGDKWLDIEWIEERADELRRQGHGHGALKRATAERFAKITLREKQTEPELGKFEKRIKNARDEWSRVERLHRAARARQPRAALNRRRRTA